MTAGDERRWSKGPGSAVFALVTSNAGAISFAAFALGMGLGVALFGNVIVLVFGSGFAGVIVYWWRCARVRAVFVEGELLLRNRFRSRTISLQSIVQIIVRNLDWDSKSPPVLVVEYREKPKRAGQAHIGARRRIQIEASASPSREIRAALTDGLRRHGLTPGAELGFLRRSDQFFKSFALFRIDSDRSILRTVLTLLLLVATIAALSQFLD